MSITIDIERLAREFPNATVLQTGDLAVIKTKHRVSGKPFTIEIRRMTDGRMGWRYNGGAWKEWKSE